MEIEKIKITDIKPAEYNPRQITSEELTKLKNSINEFGLVDPIIINLNNNKIIGGHQRYEVLVQQHLLDGDYYDELNMIRLGDVGWIFIDEDLHIESEDHEKALNLALNKISGEWEYQKLGNILEELSLNDFNIELTGFEDLEIGFYTDTDEIDFNPFDYEEDEEDELPEDYAEVEGDNAGKSYVISISFDTRELANKFLEYLEYPRKMNMDTIQFDYDELNLELE